MITTTLKDIRAASPCADVWANLLDHLGKTPAEARDDATPLPVLTVLESNGLDDALWVVDNCIGGSIRRLIAGDYADQALRLYEAQFPGDDRPRRAVEAMLANCAPEGPVAAGVVAWSDVWAARAVWDARDSAGAAARAAAREAQTARLRQYLEHGEAAAQMPWPEVQS